MAKPTYKEIARLVNGKTRSVVFSECSAGGITIAQQIKTRDIEGHEQIVFMKGAIHLSDEKTIRDFRDILVSILDGFDEKRDRIDWDA